MSAVKIYGIKNCDTMKKARAWLESNGVIADFHDYKIAGVDEATLRNWIARTGWEPLLNRAGTTFRKLPGQDRADIDEAKAIALMLAHPSLIKRPVLVRDGQIIVGFRPELYQQLLAARVSGETG